jgi:hypothetical protein
LSVEEFETKWAEMLVKHDIVDNDHLFFIWELRESFVPAYFQDHFYPFLQTTARSEGFNAVLKRYMSPHDSLFHFFKQYMKLHEDIEIHEDAHEFAGEDKIVRLWTNFPMEKHIFQKYTMPLYHHFQMELHRITSYNDRDCGRGVFEIFSVQGYVIGYGRSYIVNVDFENEIYNCQCCKIKMDGILCCHLLEVMSYIGALKSIPEHYIYVDGHSLIQI